jgi:exopolysaccharide biosynthesis polyprenyl glycosylphosphotransferase
MAGNSPSIQLREQSVADPTEPNASAAAKRAAVQTQEVVLPSAKMRRSQRLQTLLNVMLIVLDLVMLVMAFALGYTMREYLPFFGEAGFINFQQYIPTLLLHVLTIMLILYSARMYHLPRVSSRFDQIRSIVGVVTLGAFLTSGLQEFIFRNSAFDVHYPRSLLFYVWFFSVALVMLGREVQRFAVVQVRRRRWARDNLLVVGTGEVAQYIVMKIKHSPELGYNLIGVINGQQPHESHLPVPIVGHYEQLPDLIDNYQVAQVIIALPDAKRSELVELVSLCQRGRVDIKVYPDIFAHMAGDLTVDDIGGTPLITVRDIALRGWKLSQKRALDVFGALGGLVFLSPLMLLTALIIYLQDRGPVFFTQERIGRDGQPFPMIKFRSMRVDAEAAGPGWTTEGDPRVTPIGRFMRRTSWDEIPQLINVLLGHMSLVGPRPEREVWVNEFRKQIPRYMERHREMVGMTGWAQVHGLRGDTSIAQRTTYDLWYVENWSLWLDIKIIFRTVMQTLLRKSDNAY